MGDGGSGSAAAERLGDLLGDPGVLFPLGEPRGEAEPGEGLQGGVLARVIAARGVGTTEGSACERCN